jgi:hypothetical protein
VDLTEGKVDANQQQCDRQLILIDGAWKVQVLFQGDIDGFSES